MKQLSLFLLIGLMTISSALAQNVNRAFLGIYSDHISKEKALKLGFENLYGSYVTGIFKNTAAERAGIRPFDYIIGINKDEVTAKKSLTSLLCQYRPDDKVSVQFIRNGVLNSKNIILGAVHDVQEPSDCIYEKAFLGVEQIENIPNYNGVKVNIVDLSTAAQIQLRDGDVIQKINNFPILDWKDLKTAVSYLSPQDKVIVEVIRGQKRVVVSGRIDSYKKTEERRLSDEAMQQPTIPDGTDYEQYLNETLANLAQQDLPVMSEAELGAYEIPEISIEDFDESANVSVMDLKFDNDLEVDKLNFFPHSDRGIFELTFILNNKGDTTAKILNELGEEVYRFDLENFGGTFKDEVDLSNTPRGTYFLELSQNDKSLSKKLILE